MKNVTEQQLDNNKILLINEINNLHLSTDLKNSEEIKRTDNYFQWLTTKTSMVVNEKTYANSNQSKIKRGSVVWIEFGFNIGSEFGGRHPAIILRKSGNSVFVIPLSSQAPENKKPYHVCINKVYEFKNMMRWVNVLNLQKVSIQRIDFNASIGNVKGDVLDDINGAIKVTHVF